MTQLYAILAGIGAILGAALVSYLKGRADAKALARARNDRDNLETLERINNAPLASDAADALQRLRERKPTGSVQRNRQ